jgi:hypothetical protein
VFTENGFRRPKGVIANLFDQGILVPRDASNDLSPEPNSPLIVKEGGVLKDGRACCQIQSSAELAGFEGWLRWRFSRFQARYNCESFCNRADIASGVISSDQPRLSRLRSG